MILNYTPDAVIFKILGQRLECDFFGTSRETVIYLVVAFFSYFRIRRHGTIILGLSDLRTGSRNKKQEIPGLLSTFV